MKLIELYADKQMRICQHTYVRLTSGSENNVDHSS